MGASAVGPLQTAAPNVRADPPMRRVTVQSPRSLRPAIQTGAGVGGRVGDEVPVGAVGARAATGDLPPAGTVETASRSGRPTVHASVGWSHAREGFALREGLALRTPCPDAGGRAGPSASRQPSKSACRGRPRRRTPYCEAARATSAASPESARYMGRAPRAGRATGAAGSIARSTHLEPHGILSRCGSLEREARPPAVRRHETGSSVLFGP